jgi:hypothetical protein
VVLIFTWINNNFKKIKLLTFTDINFYFMVKNKTNSIE